MSKRIIFAFISFGLAAVLALYGFSYGAQADSTEAQIDQLTTSLINLNRNKHEGNEAELAQIASKRKALLLDAAIHNPLVFLNVTKLAGQRSNFPAPIQSDIEEVVEKEGEILVVHFDGKNTSKTDYKLITTDANVLELHFAKNTPQLPTGSKIKIKAIRLDSHLVLEAGNKSAGTTSMQTVATASVSTTGTENTAVLLVNFANDASQPVTASDIAATLFTNADSVNAYYQDNSFNQTSLTGQVHGWFTLPTDNSSCESNYYNWSTQADSLATASGVNLSLYSKIVYVFATPPTCGYLALGTIGGTPGRSWVFNYYSDGRVFGHELGHNYGVHHAASLSCGAKTIDVYGNCAYDEYGDYFDVMGNFWYVSPSMLHFNGAHKMTVGWIPQDRVQTATASAIYHVYNEESLSTAAQVIKINKPDTGESYYVSYRQPIGFDTGLVAGMTRGVSIHVWNGNAFVQTKLLDASPLVGDFNGFGDATMQDGQHFIDVANGFELVQKSHDQSYAEVEIIFPDGIAPTVAITSPTNGSVVLRNRSITVKATASDNVKVTKVEFRRNGSLVCTDTTAPYSCKMFTDKLSKTNVSYEAQAYDAINNTSVSSVTVTTK